jgi:hypothetical protein
MKHYTYREVQETVYALRRYADYLEQVSHEANRTRMITQAPGRWAEEITVPSGVISVEPYGWKAKTDA